MGKSKEGQIICLSERLQLDSLEKNFDLTRSLSKKGRRSEEKKNNKISIFA